MTRDAEHTPSPQSVVVPLEDWRHVIGALKNAKARLPMGAAIGNVSDALSKVEHLQAPAPSSLAGGEEAEFATALARVLDRHGLRDAGWADAAIDEALSVVREPSAVSRATVDAILPMISERLAALSPEAPARKVLTAKTPADLLDKVYAAEGWTRSEGEVRSRRANTKYVTTRDNRAGVYVATPITDALTPRHEAPASDSEAMQRSMQQILDHDEAPAEGAGEALVDMAKALARADGERPDEEWYAVEVGDAPKLWQRYLPLARVALRSRSSAPEARLTVIDPDQWAPCSPEWLKRHPSGSCGKAPRVWCEAESNHYHPVNWPEAPAEGAGDFGDALLALFYRHGLKVALDVSEIEALRQSALRSRSSAPEAREEALGNLLAVIHGDGGHRALEVGVEQAAAEAEKIVARLLSSAPEAREGEAVAWVPVGLDGIPEWELTYPEDASSKFDPDRTPLRLYTRPAAPSADKLRIASAALEPFANFVTPAVKWMKDADVVSAGSPLARKQLTYGDCRRAAEALADLKAEGA